MRRALRWLGHIALALLAGLGAYVAYGTVAWRDLSPATIEQRYGAGAQTALVDGVPLRYRLDGAGPPLVLVHSHYLDMGMWDGWLPALTPHFRVLRYDLTGHGLTGPDPSGVYTVARDVALLRGLLDRLGLGPVAVAGSSVGGNIAFTLAAAEPARVRALVLVNSGGLRRANRPAGGTIPRFADHVLPLVPPLALHAFLRWMIVDDARVTPALRERFVDLWRREGNRVAELERLRQFDVGDPEATLAQVTAPTLVLWGEANPQLPLELGRQFPSRLTRAAAVTFRSYPGAGHVLPVERPEATAADTLAFLRSVVAPAP